jgi:hypothetical protein
MNPSSHFLHLVSSARRHLVALLGRSHIFRQPRCRFLSLAFIAGIGSPKLRIWNPFRQGTTESVVEFIGHAKSLAFSPSSGLLAVPHGSKVALYSLAP